MRFVSQTINPANVVIGLRKSIVHSGGIMAKNSRVVLSALVFLTLSSAAWGWDFSLYGNFSWTYETYAQGGKAGFFGTYDVDASTAASNYASLNGWFGQLGLVSGSKAAQTTMVTELFPVFKISEAFGLTGKYRIDVYGDTTGSSYLINSAPGVTIPFSDGKWDLWSVYAILPFGNVFYGKRPFSAGLGLQFDGVSNRTIEAFVISVDYGPLTLKGGLNPYRDILTLAASVASSHKYHRRQQVCNL